MTLGSHYYVVRISRCGQRVPPLERPRALSLLPSCYRPKVHPLFPILPWHISPLILFWKFCLQSLPLNLPLTYTSALHKKRANVWGATTCSWGQEGSADKNLLFEGGMRAEGRTPDPKISPDWWQNPGWGGRGGQWAEVGEHKAGFSSLRHCCLAMDFPTFPGAAPLLSLAWVASLSQDSVPHGWLLNEFCLLDCHCIIQAWVKPDSKNPSCQNPGRLWQQDLLLGNLPPVGSGFYF